MILDNQEFKNLKVKHSKEILEFLISSSTPFSIIALKNLIEFNPDLPEKIKENFGEIILFKLANYTLSTATIENNKLLFEAGFGEENIGSVVSVPLKSILQILVDETPIFTNPAADDKEEKNPFVLNPKNKKLID